MGKILNSKSLPNGKIIFEIMLDYEEALQLKGHVTNIHVFSENTLDISTNMSMRGRKEATKYFLIPKELRKGIKFKSPVKCQQIETPSKIMFVYIIDKFAEL